MKHFRAHDREEISMVDRPSHDRLVRYALIFTADCVKNLEMHQAFEMPLDKVRLDEA